VQFCQEQGLRRFAELVDQLVMLGPGFVSEAVCELEGFSVAEFAAFEYHAYGLARCSTCRWANHPTQPVFVYSNHITATTSAVHTSVYCHL